MRKEKADFVPSEEQKAVLPKQSGNVINGLGEREVRRPTPVYWHKPETIAHGPAQQWMTDKFNAVEELEAVYSHAGARGPRKLDPVNDIKQENTAEAWTTLVKQFALANEADLVGIAALQPEWVFEGYDVAKELPWIIMLGIEMEHKEFAAAPSSDTDTRSAIEVADKYNKGARAAAFLSNWVRGQGYQAKPHAGPWAGSLTLSPAAIAAGFGELGDHGNIINDVYGSSFRLAAVSTDMPLTADAPREFGADEFCSRCQVCIKACPVGAITSEKQWVRGVKKYYVNFDKCLPYFNETHGCGICLAVCPWSRPGGAQKLVNKLARRKEKTGTTLKLKEKLEKT